jgi:hypothetical protein
VTSGPLLFALLQAVAGMDPGSDSPATPSSTVIAVILPSDPDTSMLEALNRLRGEADSVGFELRLVNAEANADPRTQLDSVARGLAPAAVVALVGKRGAEGASGSPIGSIDVWFLDRSTTRTSVGHLTVDDDAGDRADLLLAVRVVDFIRARMFDSLVRTLAESKTRRRQVVAHELEGRGFAAAGVAGTGSFSGLPAAWLPTLEIGYSVKKWLRLSLGASGLGSQPRRGTAAGSVTMDQKLVKVSATFVARTSWRLAPFVEVGAAAYFVSARGEGVSGNVGYNPSAWSPGAIASAGLGIVLAPHVFVQLTGGGMLLQNEPKVLVADTEVARAGRPSWLTNALLGITF